MAAEKVVVGACPQDCPDTCSMLFRVRDGAVASVAGNPSHPFTNGRLCVKVKNYEERVHSRSRVLTPLQRTGAKGQNAFRPISWKTALSEISARWRAIIAEYGPQAIVPYSYLGTQGILNGLTVGDPFFNRLGATITERTFCDSGACTAYAMTIGDSPAVDPESFAHSRFILLWASNLIATNSHHWPFIEQARKAGAKVVVIDPIRSQTARMADEHVRIRPGTDAALALGMINVIITEGLTDREYVAGYTVGFAALADRARDFPPQKVEELTGVPQATVVRLARDFATIQPSVIRIGVAIERHSGGGQAVRAISCLPALTGSWRRPGGGVMQLTIWAFPVNWPRLTRPDFIREPVRVLNQWRLGDALTGRLGLDPPVKGLFVYNANPVAQVPEQSKVIEGLRRRDLFTVVSEQFLTDTASYADIVLPATTQAEQEDIMFSWGHLYLSYNNRSIPPLGQAVPNSELFRRLAGAMGFADSYFYRTDAEMIREAMFWDDPRLSGISLEQLKETGFSRLNVPPPHEYAPHASGNFRTPSNKCEFASSMAAAGNFVLPLFRQGYDGQQLGDAVDPLPTYIPPMESAQTNPELARRFPLALVSPKSQSFLSSSYGNLPRNRQHAGEQSITIHPDDAAARGIAEGDAVTVRNDRGRFRAVARVSDDAMPGVVVAPVGYWPSLIPGRSTVHSVTSARFADLGGAPTFSDVLVDVQPVQAQR